MKSKHDKKLFFQNKTREYVKSLGVATLLGLVSSGMLLFATPSTIINATDITDESTEVEKDGTVEIPEQITNENIVASGLDGTAPYYVTEPVKGAGYNLYFLDGTLGEIEGFMNPTRAIINDIQAGNISGVEAGFVNKIDTSLAQNAVVAPKDASGLFARLNEYDPNKFETIYTDLNLNKLDTSNTENMTEMFYESKLSDSDLSNFDTSKVTNMNQMFSGSVLNNLDLSNFDTSKVTNMANMFFRSVLNNIDLSNFDTSQVTNMADMFNSTELVDNKLDLSSFNTSKVTSMNGMFSNLHSQLEDGKVDDLNLSNFNLSGIEGLGLEKMFSSSKIKNLELDSFENPSGKITSLNYMFTSANVDKISMKNFDTSTIDNFYGMFSYATIGDLDISNFDMTNSDNPGVNMFEEAMITSITLGPNNRFYRIDKDGNQVDSGSGIGDIITKETNISYDFMIPTTVDGEPVNDTILTFNFKGTTEPQATVPVKSGYTSNFSKFTATIDKYWTPTVDPDLTGLTIEYTKKPTDNNHNSGGGSNTNNNHQENITPTNKQQLVATYPDGGSVTLYKLENNKFTEVGNRALAKASDWYADKLADTKDMTYYRVASNEWVKASDVYIYEPIIIVYNTESAITYLLNSHNSTVNNRALSPETSWSVDRIGYLGDYKNPIKAYRVASNEFVKY